MYNVLVLFFWCVYDYNIYKVPPKKVTIRFKYIFVFFFNPFVSDEFWTSYIYSVGLEFATTLEKRSTTLRNFFRKIQLLYFVSVRSWVFYLIHPFKTLRYCLVLSFKQQVETYKSSIIVCCLLRVLQILESLHHNLVCSLYKIQKALKMISSRYLLPSGIRHERDRIDKSCIVRDFCSASFSCEGSIL